MEPSHDIKVQNPQEVEITSQRNHSGNGKVEADINNGVCLTWKDLCVMVPDGQTGGTRSILQGVTGYARPGELLAIMGPSGSGKSTLLDALAGRLDRKTRNTGDILVNGIKKTLAYGTSAYVTQDDTLITTLTVRESVYYSAQLQLPDSMSKTEKKERAEMTIKEMGLQDSIDTRIGGWGAKGLSGGQKRRVSICIEILTRPKLLFLDEPTSGLDSAASYYVMSRIARLDQHEGRTIIASIHQPSSEVFGLFHNLCLLSSGRTVYFGKTSYANEFFTLNGFPCPNFQNPSDHFLRTINKDFDEDIELGLGGRKPTEEVIKTLVDSYKSSTTYQEVNNTVAEICEKARSSMLMFVASFLTFMAIGGFPSFVEDMKVFERERLNGHYSTGAFVIANTLSSIPYLLLVSVIPGVVAYYLAGLRDGFDHFVYFTSVIFACMLVVESLMMTIASVVPNYLLGIIVGAGIQGFMMISGGFFRLPNDLPDPFWRYPLFYIGFHKYAFQGLFKNEFEGVRYAYNEAGVPKVMDGEYILRVKWQVEMGYSKWIDLLVLLGMVVVWRVLFCVFIMIAEKVKSGSMTLVSSIPEKQKVQVMVNPVATPSH
ncbi:ABC transporter G family member 11 isoform X2 [Helianthus annuus]|uniref:ABC transporter G family member 11 isoform X2 n=1 Tax=Helianthus annuus TaxID=4232 RepID=UPI000B8FFA98|nr:ABC transporter G family member 11 isoform X2 [Helianthus annuus]